MNIFQCALYYAYKYILTYDWLILSMEMYVCMFECIYMQDRRDGLRFRDPMHICMHDWGFQNGDFEGAIWEQKCVQINRIDETTASGRWTQNDKLREGWWRLRRREWFVSSLPTGEVWDPTLFFCIQIMPAFNVTYPFLPHHHSAMLIHVTQMPHHPAHH